mmetsp:Transcript_3038/g.4642  ORF Transcript_3038/g.4642 Transcript_3038/m.4642 type:complete len:248 (+) Transcript_3038:592-1335(+)
MLFLDFDDDVRSSVEVSAGNIGFISPVGVMITFFLPTRRAFFFTVVGVLDSEGVTLVVWESCEAVLLCRGGVSPLLGTPEAVLSPSSSSSEAMIFDFNFFFSWSSICCNVCALISSYETSRARGSESSEPTLSPSLLSSLNVKARSMTASSTDVSDGRRALSAFILFLTSVLMSELEARRSFTFRASHVALADSFHAIILGINFGGIRWRIFSSIWLGPDGSVAVSIVVIVSSQELFAVSTLLSTDL